MTLSDRTLRAFRNYRREHPYTSASVALTVAKRQTTDPTWAADLIGSGDRYTGTLPGGYDVVITMEYDDDTDTSWLGEWTDDPTGAVPNPDPDSGRGSYKYFRPENIEPWEGYWRQGMSRAAARARVRQAMTEDAREALEPAYVVTVRVSREGIELGSDRLGGCRGYESALWAADDHDMVGNALHEARETLVRLGVRLSEVDA
jgi:hypothetical protein